jgi:hypothetical protein
MNGAFVHIVLSTFPPSRSILRLLPAYNIYREEWASLITCIGLAKDRDRERLIIAVVFFLIGVAVAALIIHFAVP